jgi:hypothetical protein
MRTARTLKAEFWQVLRGRVGTGAKEDKSSTGRFWAAGFHHVSVHSRLVLFETYESFIYLFIFQVFFRATVNRGY